MMDPRLALMACVWLLVFIIQQPGMFFESQTLGHFPLSVLISNMNVLR